MPNKYENLAEKKKSSRRNVKNYLRNHSKKVPKKFICCDQVILSHAVLRIRSFNVKTTLHSNTPLSKATKCQPNECVEAESFNPHRFLLRNRNSLLPLCRCPQHARSLLPLSTFHFS